MRSRSNLWKSITARGEFQMETIVRIYDATGNDPNATYGYDSGKYYKEYTLITAPIITRNLLSGDTLSLGNCCIGSLQFTIMTTDTIPKSAKIVVRGRPTNGTDVAEWMNFGTFWLDTREATENLTDITAFDAMKMGYQGYSDNSQGMQWPKTIAVVVQRIAQQMKVSIDSRTLTEVIQSAYGGMEIITKPNDEDTLLDILKHIGEILGGNWTITPENKLRFVWLGTIPADTNYIVDDSFGRITSNEGDDLIWANNNSVASNNGAEILNIPVVIGSIATSRNYTVTKVTMSDNEDAVYSYGTTAGYEIVIENNPYATDALCRALYNRINGIEYAPFELDGACYDPATELGDGLKAGDQVRSILYAEEMMFDVNVRAAVTAPGEDETESEYPYQTAIKRIKYQVDNNSKVTGVLTSRITQTQSRISAEVVRAQGSEYTLSSRITLNEQGIEMRVEKDGVISSINQSPESIVINANRVDLRGLVTISDLAGTGTTTIDGSNIQTGSINAARLEASVITAINSSTETSGDDPDVPLTIEASKIDINGVVNFGSLVTSTDLSTAGSTIINGGNITTGELNANRIKGGTLTLGGANNGNGKIVLKNANDKIILEMNKDGLSFSEGRIEDSTGTSYWDLSDGDLQIEGTFTTDNGENKTILGNGLLTFYHNSVGVCSIGSRNSYVSGLMPVGDSGSTGINALVVNSGVITGGSEVSANTNGELHLQSNKIIVSKLGGQLTWLDRTAYTNTITSFQTMEIINGLIVSVT